VQLVPRPGTIKEPSRPTDAPIVSCGTEAEGQASIHEELEAWKAAAVASDSVVAAGAAAPPGCRRIGRLLERSPLAMYVDVTPALAENGASARLCVPGIAST
jgi:hypothetical protein